MAPTETKRAERQAFPAGHFVVASKVPQGTGASPGGGEWVWARKTRL